MSFTTPTPARTWVDAVYTPQDVPAYRGNRLIEALPPILDELATARSLTYTPRSGGLERALPTHERIHRVMELKNFMIPLERHLELATSIDLMIRGGYVGRSIRTEDSAKAAQLRYESQKKGVAYQQSPDSVTPQLCGKLLGLSGGGKTTALRRILACTPQVIYHSEEHVYQVTHMTVEAPTDGTSLRGVCQAIIKKLDFLLPGANYLEEYGGRGRDSAESAKILASSLLDRHFVGLVAIEECQNFDKSNKSAETVMAELTSLVNDLAVPLLFLGTNAATSVTNLDFRLARRAAGMPIAYWDRLNEQVASDKPPEWRQFVRALWRLLLVREPVELDELILLKLYEYSQGIVMLAIGLVFCAQLQAMRDGTETVTAELIEKMYYRYFEPDLGVMIKALRDNDQETLAKFADLRPVMSRALDRATQDAGAGGARVATRAPAPVVVEAGVHDEAQEEGPKTPTKRKRKRKPSVVSPVARAIPDLTDRPDDYRNAIVGAMQSGKSVSEELDARHMAPHLFEVLSPD